MNSKRITEIGGCAPSTLSSTSIRGGRGDGGRGDGGRGDGGRGDGGRGGDGGDVGGGGSESIDRQPTNPWAS